MKVLKNCGCGNIVLKMEYEVSTDGSFLSCKTFALNVNTNSKRASNKVEIFGVNYCSFWDTKTGPP